MVATRRAMDHCCEAKSQELGQLREAQGRLLKIVLFINLGMFVIEFGAGFWSQSTALLADSLDMLGDALVYGFSLYVLHKSPKWRVSAAILKGAIIAAFGAGVLIEVVRRMLLDTLPRAEWMGSIGFLALAANALCLYLLTRHRNDDINMRSTWECSRNDIVANIGVLAAAGLVSFTQSKWPDILIGLIVALVFLRSAIFVLGRSVKEYRQIVYGSNMNPCTK